MDSESAGGWIWDRRGPKGREFAPQTTDGRSYAESCTDAQLSEDNYSCVRKPCYASLSGSKFIFLKTPAGFLRKTKFLTRKVGSAYAFARLPKLVYTYRMCIAGGEPMWYNLIIKEMRTPHPRKHLPVCRGSGETQNTNVKGRRNYEE
jgi:hypothetical protein